MIRNVSCGFRSKPNFIPASFQKITKIDVPTNGIHTGTVEYATETTSTQVVLSETTDIIKPGYFIKFYIDNTCMSDEYKVKSVYNTTRKCYIQLETPPDKNYIDHYVRTFYNVITEVNRERVPDPFC